MIWTRRFLNPILQAINQHLQVSPLKPKQIQQRKQALIKQSLIRQAQAKQKQMQQQ